MSTTATCPDIELPPIDAYCGDAANDRSTEPEQQPQVVQKQISMPERLDVANCFARKPAPYDFVLPGMLVGTVGLLTSPGGAGKSIFAIQLAASVATGTDRLGIGVEKAGDVLFVAAEDPSEVLHHRLHDLGKHYSPPEMQAIASRCDFRCTIGMGIDIMSDRWYDWLISQSAGKRLVIIDTLTRIHTLDEKDAGDAAQIMIRLESIAHRNRCGVLVLHHINKSSALAGEGDAQQAARGSSVFVDNARWGSFMSVMDKKEAEGRKIAERRKYVRWNINKQNYSAPFSDVWFERAGGGILVPADFQPVEAKAVTYAAASNGGVSDEKTDFDF